MKLQLNHWCHMDYFAFALIVLVPLLSMEGQRALRFHQKYLNLCSEDKRKSYGFGTTWGWVINDRIFIFEWTIPLRIALCVTGTAAMTSSWRHALSAIRTKTSRWCRPAAASYCVTVRHRAQPKSVIELSNYRPSGLTEAVQMNAAFWSILSVHMMCSS